MTYTKNLKDKFSKDNQMIQMTLKKYIDHFQQELNNAASTPTSTSA